MAAKYAFAQGLREVRFLFCQSSEQSAPLRYDSAAMCQSHNRSTFLTRSYPVMKKHNPHTPIMLREALNTPPQIYARYGMLLITGSRS